MPLTILSEEGSKLMQSIIIEEMINLIARSFDVLKHDSTSQKDNEIHYSRIRNLCDDLQSIATQLSNQKFKPNQNEVNF